MFNILATFGTGRSCMLGAVMRAGRRVSMLLTVVRAAPLMARFTGLPASCAAEHEEI